MKKISGFLLFFFLSETFQFLVVIFFSVYLNRHVFVMVLKRVDCNCCYDDVL